MEVTLEGTRYTIKDRTSSGLLTDQHTCEYEVSGTSTVTGAPKTVFERLVDEDDLWATSAGIAKLTRDARNNDLAENEVRNLRQLYPPSSPEEKFRRYLPRVIAAGVHAGKHVTVFPPYSAFVSMQRVREAFPTGLDFRDVVWMWKRSLAALWFVHNNGIVHGAILPPHVLVHPTDHGAKLIEWSFSAQSRERVPAMLAEYGPFYAPEIPRKRQVTPATDIFMLSKCVLALLGGNPETNTMPDAVPEPLQGFLLEGLAEDTGERPDDAGALHEALDALLLRTVGKPTYRALVMPHA